VSDTAQVELRSGRVQAPGHRRLTKHLMKRGAAVNRQNADGQTALHFCLGLGHSELGDYLLAKGADDSVANTHGLTPFEGLRP